MHDGLRGPDEPTWQQELLADSDNLDAAYAWWLENRDPDTLADIGWALWTYAGRSILAPNGVDPKPGLLPVLQSGF